ncbi:MAG: hypothetical protein KIS90_16935 [Phenylobacterium sp.]|nr:hypothetical protein [Phenylobacterium sp.]
MFAEGRTLKAVSLWQPYAALTARGLKTILTMHRPTDHRGPVAIHAAATIDLAGAPDDLCLSGLGPHWADQVARSAMVAVATLFDCTPCADLDTSRLTRAERAAGVFSGLRFAWRLADIRTLRRPIPCAGRQGLFNWTPPGDLDDRLGPPRDHLALAHAIGWGMRPRADA